MRNWLLIALIGALVWYFWPEDDTWIGHVYPNASNLLVDRFIGQYSSLEDCRRAATRVIADSGWENADYECGLNCKRDSSFGGLWICEDTLR